MSEFEQLSAALSGAGVQVSLAIRSAVAMPGGILTGGATISGGSASQFCSRVSVRLRFTGVTDPFKEQLLAQALELGPGERETFAFALDLPETVPAGAELIVEASAAIPGALAPTAQLSVPMRLQIPSSPMHNELTCDG